MKIKIARIALLVGVLTSVSQAASIVPVDLNGSQPANQGDGTTTNWVNTFPEVSPNLVLLAKWTPTNSWSSLVSGVSGANFTVTPNISGDSTATITWNLTGSGYSLYAIMGSQSSELNLYSVTGGSLTGSGSVAAPGNGNGWSHISFFGKAGSVINQTGNPVPEGGTTLVALGVALFGLGSMRRLTGSKAKT